MSFKNVIITGTGKYIPEKIVTNADFAKNVFYDENSIKFESDHAEIAEKFKAITGIEERRYANDEQCASDLGTIAANLAIKDADIDPETIDQIIVAQNFGDVKKGTIQTDVLPSIASRIKQNLGIKNPSCVAYDIVFGCPGWVQGMIQAYSFIKSGMAKRCLVVSAETLSRVLDMHDRDSMIYSDGAGAAVVEASEGDTEKGILSYSMETHALDEAYYLFLGKSNINDTDPNVRYIKMFGRKIYEFALTNVPAAMKLAMENANADIKDLKKIFIHQANEKMDFEIIKRFYRLYKERNIPEYIMPMSIHQLGNSSVGTVPTLFDMVRKGECQQIYHDGVRVSQGDHQLNEGDLIMFASVGAGMNINAICYRY
ncbi:MAG: 3-oxoacyl-ACP synthase [Marinilabiliales bacterium]|nr:MAG: 3-oxoacyl-ACP synthase [Marinilabiliales bacterium]